MINRYAIDIGAPPERVFYWMDDPDRVLLWVPNLEENEDLDVTEDKIGSTFRQVYVEHGRRMEMRGVVTAYEPNRRLACDIDGEGFELSVDYRLEKQGGLTRLEQIATVRFKGVWRLIGPIMSFFMRKSSHAQLEESFNKLKQLAESTDDTAIE